MTPPPRLVLTLAVLGACVTDPPKDGMPRLAQNSLVEQRRGFEQVVPRGHVAAADPRGDLLLRFERHEPAGADAGESELLAALRSAEALMLERRAALKRFETVDTMDVAQLRKMQKESAAFSGKVAALVVGLTSKGLTSADVRAINADKQPGEQDLFPALVRWLKARFEAAKDQFENRRLAAAERQVTVQARIESARGDAKYLHIDGYDELPTGQMKPVYGSYLGGSREEIERLESDLRTVERAAGLLRSIRRAGGDARATIDALGGELERALEALAQRLEDAPLDVITDFGTRVSAAATTIDTSDATAAATAVAGALATYQQLATDATGLVTDARALRDALRAPTATSLSNLLGAGGQVRAFWASAKPKLERLLENISKLPEAVATLGENLDALSLSPPPELAPFLAALREATRPAQELLSLLAAVENGDRAARAAENVEEIPVDQQIFQPLSSASDARIRLGSTDVREGDRVHVDVIYQPLGASGLEGRVVESWEVEVSRFGLYPRIGAELIFARADTGTAEAKSWQANVAAVAEVHQRFRNPNWLGAIWNAIDPSVGVHVASLDQGDESVEFGLGVNVSVLGGFLTGGFGANLSADNDREYWFVGIDLIEVLTAASSAVGG